MAEMGDFWIDIFPVTNREFATLGGSERPCDPGGADPTGGGYAGAAPEDPRPGDQRQSDLAHRLPLRGASWRRDGQ